MVPYIENTSASTLYAILVGTLMEDGQEAPALRTENGDMYITSINMHAG